MFAPTIGGQPVDGRLGVRLRVLVFTRNLGCGHITPGDHERRVVVGVYLIPQGTPEVRQVREEDRRPQSRARAPDTANRVPELRAHEYRTRMIWDISKPLNNHVSGY